ncbi:CDP-alcohol phosphatidyltransferase family protein [Enterococcus sp. LJL98]
MNTAKQIKKENKPSLKEFFLASFLISQRISPYLSSVYIKKGIKPNTITLHMIYSGILGAVLFAMPNTYIKVLGVLFIHLWFILDCSDGEVARYTKKFSKYGKELDYMAHLINHPLFGIALFCSLVQLNRYSFYILSVLVLLSNLLDYLTRNLNTLDLVINLKAENKSIRSSSSTNWSLKEFILFVASLFMVYPNFILFSVLFFFIDYWVGTNIVYVYLILNIFITFIFNLKGMTQLVRKFHNE